MHADPPDNLLNDRVVRELLDTCLAAGFKRGVPPSHDTRSWVEVSRVNREAGPGECCSTFFDITTEDDVGVYKATIKMSVRGFSPLEKKADKKVEKKAERKGG